MIPQCSEHFDNPGHDLDEKNHETPCNEPIYVQIGWLKITCKEFSSQRSTSQGNLASVCMSVQHLNHTEPKQSFAEPLFIVFHI